MSAGEWGQLTVWLIIVGAPVILIARRAAEAWTRHELRATARRRLAVPLVFR